MNVYLYDCVLVVPHKAAEVSKIGHLQDRLVVVSHGWQSEDTDRQVVEVSSLSVPFLLFLRLSTYLPNNLASYLAIKLSSYLAIRLSIYQATYLSIKQPIYLYSSLAL